MLYLYTVIVISTTRAVAIDVGADNQLTALPMIGTHGLQYGKHGLGQKKVYQSDSIHWLIKHPEGNAAADEVWLRLIWIQMV